MVIKTLIKNETVYDWVQIAKGIGIILVVIGHFCPNNSPEYWRFIKKIIYLFHMPLFFFLSGFLFRYEKYPYLLLINKKINRLLFPLIMIAILFLVIKYITGFFFQLDNPVNVESVYALFTDPVNSYMPLLWFVYTLFLIFIIYPVFRKVFISNLVILGLFILFNFLFVNNFPIIGAVLINMPFFVIGVMFLEKRDMRIKLISGKPIMCVLFIIIFILIQWFFEMFKMNGLYYYLRFFTSAIFGILCVSNISLLIDSMAHSGWLRHVLLTLGFYSMTIYLFHTLFESTVRIMFYQVLADIQAGFELVTLCAIIAGIVFPLILEKFILRRFRFTRRYILGIT